MTLFIYGKSVSDEVRLLGLTKSEPKVSRGYVLPQERAEAVIQLR